MLKQTFQTALTDVWATQYDALGDIRVENGKVYKYVKFTGTTAFAAGDALCYTDNTCQIVDAANAAVGAGIAVAAVAAGTVQYGWIQIGGLCTLNQAIGGTSPAAGNVLTNTAAAAKVLTKAAAVTDDAVAVAVDIANKIVQLVYPW